ncbi:MAG: NAD(P)/FAD-dependent oxidoreductase [Candidatus Thermoplasmatota archaeon]|nr:NAD(P)/FAD-dependent oxidoreductase [Candidatus Thermoplasmatota archaeon]
MEFRDRYDVVVVGAGPGGSVTARFAALNGARTLLLEKRQDIGSPVRCGEGLSKAHLHEAGIKVDKRWLANEVEGAHIISPSGYRLTISEKHAGNEVGMVIERDIFDKVQAFEAAKAGAEIMVKATVTDVIKENGDVIGVRVDHFGERFNVKAGCVVAADGFESQVGRWAGLNTRLKGGDIMSGLQYRLTGVEVDPAYCEFYLGNSVAPGGYLWYFPKSEDTVNVGIGVMAKRVKEKADAKTYLDRFIEKDPRVRKGKPLDWVAGGVSTSPPLERTVAPGIMLVGDAARQIDPITGGGIANACRSGRIAGEVLGEAAQAGDFSLSQLMKYEKGWRALMENRLYRNWLAKEKLAKLSDETLDKLIDSLADAGVEKLSVLAILHAVQKKYPELVKDFQELL